MQNVGKFEKVSFEQFSEAMKAEFGHFFKQRQNGLTDMSWMVSALFNQTTVDRALPPFEPMSDDEIRAAYDAVQLPKRATAGSAGYDFRSPFSFTLHSRQSIKIPTGIRVKIDDGWWLACVPRSGLGFKYKFRLANTVGVIDSDYYGSPNEGHIFAKICNEGDEDVNINVGDGIAQAIFVPFGITYDDEATGAREGGLGSTGA